MAPPHPPTGVAAARRGAALCALALAALCDARAVPSAAQLAWHGRFGAIIHYEMATDALSTGHGCGRGNWPGAAADPHTFGRALATCPDTDAWLDAVVAGGMDYAILVAKHNCGFVTFRTNATLPPDGRPYGYGIANSSAPAGCDVVESFLASCARSGVQPGIYYSFGTNIFLNVQGGVVSNETLMPGQALVSQREFADLVLFQVEELWRKAPLVEIWADGGVPTEPYLRDGLGKLRDQYQQNAIFYASAAADLPPTITTTTTTTTTNSLALDSTLCFSRPAPRLPRRMATPPSTKRP